MIEPCLPRLGGLAAAVSWQFKSEQPMRGRIIARCVSVWTGLALASLGSPASCHGQPFSVMRRALRSAIRSSNRQYNSTVDKYQQQLGKSAEKLQEDQKRLAQSESDVRDAKANLKTAGEHKKEVLKRATGRAEDQAGLSRALSDLSQAKDDYDSAARPILDRLKKTAAYREALAQAASVPARLKTIREDRSFSESERSRLQSETNQEIFAPDQLERESIAADPHVQGLKERYQEAQQQVAALRGQIHQAVADDPAVISADSEIAEARASLIAAESTLKGLGEHVAVAEERLENGLVDPRVQNAPRTGAARKASAGQPPAKP